MDLPTSGHEHTQSPAHISEALLVWQRITHKGWEGRAARWSRLSNT